MYWCCISPVVIPPYKNPNTKSLIIWKISWLLWSCSIHHFTVRTAYSYHSLILYLVCSSCLAWRQLLSPTSDSLCSTHCTINGKRGQNLYSHLLAPIHALFLPLTIIWRSHVSHIRYSSLILLPNADSTWGLPQIFIKVWCF